MTKKSPKNDNLALIQIGSRTDLVAIVEAIKTTPRQKIQCLILGSKTVLSSYFNLKLLASLCQSLGKEIVLVSQQPRVISQAQALNLETTSRPIFKKNFPPTETKSPEMEINPKPSKKNNKKLIFFLIILFGLIGFGILIFSKFIMPHKASVSITTKLKNVSSSLQVDLSSTSRQPKPNPNGVLPLHIKHIEEYLETDITPTGQSAGTLATVLVTITNCSHQNLPINQSTIFLKNEVEFKWKSNPTVIQPNCNSTDNQLSYLIEMSNPNDDPGDLNGSYIIKDQITTDINIVSTGVTTQPQQSGACISEEDLQKAKTELGRKRQDQKQKEALIEALRNEYQLRPLSRTFQVAVGQLVEPPLCPEIGEPKLNQLIVYYLGGIKDSDLEVVAGNHLQARIGSNLDIIDYGFDEADFNVYLKINQPELKPTVTHPAPIKYYVIINIKKAVAGIFLDEEKLIDLVAGQDKNKFGARLRDCSGIEEVEIQISPPWQFSFPSDKKRIEFNIVNLDKEEYGDLLLKSSNKRKDRSATDEC